MVTASKQTWELNSETENINREQIAKDLDVSLLFVDICIGRGLTTAQEIQEFIDIDENWLHDPFLMHDMEKAVKRITEALQTQEKITIYGDYDADGMTSTALLTETLASLGADVNYYLPNRFVEGYGPNTEAFQKIIEDETSLIITVDNGVTGNEAITYAQSQGVDVIVTDHHELPEKLPDAYALVHPRHPKAEYPFGDLAGVGVALKVASALTGEIPIEVFDLAAIGTVADLVSLTGENRAIVYFGLKMIEQTQRIGLLQLLKVIEKTPKEVNEETIGFQIAPRLNAVGRLGDAGPCVELLTTHEPETASELAQYVNDKNDERKMIVNNMTDEVQEQLTKMSEEYEVIVLADEQWHQGVLGIVASRIVEQTNKPTLLFTIDAETGLAKGSARSVEGFNLYEAFVENEDYFTQFGGHSMAAGMSAEVDLLPTIQKQLSTYAKQLKEYEPTQKIDAFTDLSEITTDTINEIEKLRPFGTDNQKPMIASKQVKVQQKRKVGAEGNHLKLSVGQNDRQLDIISFQNGYLHDLLFDEQEIGIAGYLENNVWNGLSKPQMQMQDIDIPGPMFIDNRLSKLTPANFEYENRTYVFYKKESYELGVKHLPESSDAYLLTSNDEIEAFESSKHLIIVDCPNSIKQLQATISNNEELVVRCYFYKENHLFLSGLPAHEDFKKAYKYFATHKDMDLMNKGHLLADHLKMDNNKIFLIVQVFLEANFVIINNGVLNIVKQPEKKNLQNTKSYQKALKQLKAEELFVYSSFKEVIAEIVK